MGGYGTATKVTMTDRINNILGKGYLQGGDVSHTDDAALIASVEYYSNAAVNSWITQEFSLNYGDFAGQSVDVEKFNIVVAACGIFDERTSIVSGNSITIDDVELVYWHALSALSYEGATLNFSEGTTSYDLSSVFYDEAKLSYTVKGQAATATKIYDPETGKLTIRVEGEDFASNADSYTEYTVQFKKVELVSSKTYSEDLYVTINGKTMDKQVANVLVDTYNNGTINFVLKNFVLVIDGEPMPVGNIAVENIELKSDNSFSFNGGIQVEDGDDPAYDEWAGPTITMLCGGSVPLDLNGKFIGEDDVIVTIAIDITSVFGQVVDVHLGYAHAAMAVDAEAKYGTFCAPFAVAVPDGVQASTVTSAAANGQLTLAEVSGTIPANTPVVLFAESGLEATDFFDIAVSGTPTAGLLTGVYENTPAPVGSYVLQNNDKVGFFQVAAGQQPTVGANRCYLIAPLGSYTVTAKAFYFEDDATGISTVDNGQWTMDNAIYNLAGQRISKMQKGVNINNGKKILR